MKMGLALRVGVGPWCRCWPFGSGLALHSLGSQLVLPVGVALPSWGWLGLALLFGVGIGHLSVVVVVIVITIKKMTLISEG